MILKDFTCASPCPVGEYPDNVGMCFPCHSTCRTCASGSISGCFSCSGSLFHCGGKCVSACPASTFKRAVTNNNRCVACSTCPSGQYTTVRCEGSTNVVCAPWSKCAIGQKQSIVCLPWLLGNGKRREAPWESARNDRCLTVPCILRRRQQIPRTARVPTARSDPSSSRSLPRQRASLQPPARLARSRQLCRLSLRIESVLCAPQAPFRSAGRRFTETCA